MEPELSSTRLQVQDFSSEGKKYAHDVAEAVAQGRRGVASELARVSENAEAAEKRHAAIKAEMDATTTATAEERAALTQKAETFRMGKMLLEPQARRLEKAAEGK